MANLFPSASWLAALCEKLNGDAHYRQVARNWEGDLIFDILPEGAMKEPISMYLDLWHGTCRRVEYGADLGSRFSPRFVLRSPYDQFSAILLGKLDPMTAMLTNKLSVIGSLGYIMRNVPTVLDFVRCAREVTTEIL